MDLKQSYESLFDPDVKKRDYEFSLEVLMARAATVWAYILEKSDRKDHTEYETGYPGKAIFSPERSPIVEMKGLFDDFKVDVDGYLFSDSPHYAYHTGFPVEFLWIDDWKTVVDEHIAEAIEKTQTQRREKLARNKIKKQEKIIRQKENRKRSSELHASILEKTKSVLTEEEFEFLVQNFYSR